VARRSLNQGSLAYEAQESDQNAVEVKTHFV